MTETALEIQVLTIFALVILFMAIEWMLVLNTTAVEIDPTEIDDQPSVANTKDKLDRLRSVM